MVGANELILFSDGMERPAPIKKRWLDDNFLNVKKKNTTRPHSNVSNQIFGNEWRHEWTDTQPIGNEQRM